jgi:hypothetical protein
VDINSCFILPGAGVEAQQRAIAQGIVQNRGLAYKIVQIAERVGVKPTILNHSTSKKTESCRVSARLPPPKISSLTGFDSGRPIVETRTAWAVPTAEHLLIYFAS